MKPVNTRSDFLLPDNEPVNCGFYAWAGMENGGHERCETNATEKIDEGEATRFRQWLADHRKSPIMLHPGPLYLCDAHVNLMRECV